MWISPSTHPQQAREQRAEPFEQVPARPTHLQDAGDQQLEVALVRVYEQFEPGAAAFSRGLPSDHGHTISMPSIPRGRTSHRTRASGSSFTNPAGCRCVTRCTYDRCGPTSFHLL